MSALLALGINPDENRQSFNALYPLADEGWWVLQIPGSRHPGPARRPRADAGRP